VRDSRTVRVPTLRILDVLTCGQKIIKWHNIHEIIS